MIGIKIKNSFWEKALLSLLKGRAEIWNPKTQYQILISDTSKGENLLIFYGMDKKAASLSLPFKIEELERLLVNRVLIYENKTFIWDAASRQLKDKNTNKMFHLTETESKIVDFLSHCPQKKATKEQLLKNVWNYTAETETHTVESTLYALRQKIGTNANELIVPMKTGYRLK